MLRAMGRHVIWVTASALVLAGCGGASEGDRVACETVVTPNNAMRALVQEDEPDGDLLRALGRGIPGEIENAQLVAESPEVKIGLSELASMADYDERMRNEDVGVAYFLYLGSLVEACQDAGVDVAYGD